MKTFSLLVLYSLLIITALALENPQNTNKQATKPQSSQLLQSFQRNLQEMPHQVHYALQIPGFKYLGLFFYFLAFRIVGIQNLLIWQLIQIYQQTKSQKQNVYFQVGDFVHGYSNPTFFALQGFGFGLIFQKINLIWEVSCILFLIAIIIKHIIAPWYKNKALKMKEQENRKIEIQPNPLIQQVKQTEETQMNLMAPKSTSKQINIVDMQLENNFLKDTKSTIRTEKKINSSKLSILSRNHTIKEHYDDSMVGKMARISPEAVDGSNLQQFKCKIKQTQSLKQQEQVSNKKTLNYEINERVNFERPLEREQIEFKLDEKQSKKLIANYYKKYKRSVLYSNVILKQVVLYMLMNSLSTIVYSGIRETQQNKDYSSSLRMSFSGYMIAISSLTMFLYTLKLVLEKGKGSGETRKKFMNFTYANKMFWLTAIAERTVYSVIIGAGWKYGIATICGLKLVVMIVAKFVNVWAKQQDYYRNLAINFIHLLIVLVLTLDQYYLSSIKKVHLSKYSIAFILLSLLALCFLINFAFLLKNVGIIGWISQKLEFSSKSSPRKNSIVLDHIFLNDNLQNDRSENSKHIKFIEARLIQQERQQKNREIGSQKRTQKLTQGMGSSLKSLGTLKSMRTLYQREIKPSVKSSVTNSLKQKSSQLMTINSQSTVQKVINSASETQGIISQRKNMKFQTRTHMQISKVINDALRAQKTQNIIFEQARENENDDDEELDVVSIRMEQKK